MWAGQAHAVNATPGLSLDLSDYIQNPGDWLRLIAADIGKYHIYGSLALFGQYLIGGLGLYTIFFKGILRSNWGVVGMTMIRTLIVLALMSSTRAGNGPVWAAIDLSSSGWVAIYDKASGLANPLIKNAIEPGTAAMAEAAHKYLMAAGAASGIAEVITTAQWHNPGNPLDDATVQSLVTAEMQARKTSPVDQASWIVQLGYLLILGFFSLYVAIIMGSALTLVLTGFTLVLAVVAWGISDGKMLKWTLMAVLGTWLTALLTPFVMVLAAKTTVQFPQHVLTRQVENHTAQLEALAYQYRDAMVQCMSNVTGTGNELGVPKWLGGDYTCSGIKAFFLQINSGLQSFFNMIRGFIIFVISLIIGQAMGAMFLRRVPAYFATALSTGIDSAVSGIQAVGAAAVARAIGGPASAASRPAMALAASGGRGLVGAATAGERAATAAGAAGRKAYGTARLANAMSNSVDNAPGRTAAGSYSDAAARLHPSNGRQTGPKAAYTGNQGTHGDTRGTTAAVGAKAGQTGRKK
ncbi:hypothetical protein K7W42_15195 [Deinococcus sp. HMF7604]|nr:hypothetical protein [Deinococcus betulae]MBZ9752200.1 hypothetical protein [Deinococcus betulae]